jgi:site-specific DNA-methyltransferase (adenine-specific)
MTPESMQRFKYDYTTTKGQTTQQKIKKITYQPKNDLSYPKTVKRFNSVPNNGKHKKIHPTEKPITLLEYLISTYSNEQDIILDNCAGSGSTAIACLNTNRQFIGIEIEKSFVEIARNRINVHTNYKKSH